MSKQLNWYSPADNACLEQAVDILQAGGIVACPTETYYGLAVDASQEAALQRLVALKGRPLVKPLLVLVADRPMVEQVAFQISSRAERLMDYFWPGALTIILPARPSLSPALTAGTGTIGVRQSSHSLAQRLTAVYGRPLTGTSANRSHHPPLLFAEEVAKEFGNAIDLILTGSPGRGGLPSTVVDLTREPPLLVRPGAIALEEIEQVVGTVERVRGNRLKESGQ
jgi:L-threonylcarbamoyladenylate synthase